MKFNIKRDSSEKPLYVEATIKASDSSYMDLLNFYFRPQEVLKDDFEKIFPKNPDYLPNHENITSTREFLPWNGWIFRGMQKAEYRLRTSFERQFFNNLFTEDQRIIKEMGIIREFQRKSKFLDPELTNIPLDDTYEYMAKFQHHGGATRFLDASFSYFVALFFALWKTDFKKQEIIIPKIQDENCNNDSHIESNKCAIWCFNRMWIEKTYKKMLPQRIAELYEKIDKFGKDTRIQKEVLTYSSTLKKNGGDYKNEFCSVINMTPYFMNSRTIRQRGTFLIPTNPYRTFEENLFNMVHSDSDAYRILKINIEYTNETLLFLRKCLDEMNINYSVLFDGLDNMCLDIVERAKIPGDTVIVSPNAGIGHN